jgi:predicted YcjX-like family ATPase
VSELRLSLKVRPSGLLGAVSGPRTVHLDIVDYPGEWLLDLALLDLDFDTWSRERWPGPNAAANIRRALLRRPDRRRHLRPSWPNPWPPPWRAAGRNTCRRAGGRLQRLHAGPLPAARRPGGQPRDHLCAAPARRAPRGSLAREFARRFEAYKREVVKPFFRAHFARIDRQIVLVDALGAIHAGPPALEDLRQAMAAILGAFRPGRNAFLSSLLGRRVDRILFAATKADHLHHDQHPALRP